MDIYNGPETANVQNLKVMEFFAHTELELESGDIIHISYQDDPIEQEGTDEPSATEEMAQPEWLPEGVHIINAQEYIANWNTNIVVLVKDSGSEGDYINIGNAQIIFDEATGSYKLRTVRHIFNAISGFSEPEVVLALGLEPSTNTAAFQLISDRLNLDIFSILLNRNTLNEDGTVDTCTFEYGSVGSGDLPDFVLTQDGLVEWRIDSAYAEYIAANYHIGILNSNPTVLNQLNEEIFANNLDIIGFMQHDAETGYSLLRFAGNPSVFEEMNSFDSDGNELAERVEYNRIIPADQICQGDSGSPINYATINPETGEVGLLVDESGRPYLSSSVASMLNPDFLESGTFCSADVVVISQNPPCEP